MQAQWDTSSHLSIMHNSQQFSHCVCAYVCVVSIYTGEIQTPVQGLTSSRMCFHGSYNLEKVLYFTSRLEKSLKFTPLSTQDTFSCKLDFFAKGNSAHPRCKNLYNSRVLLKHFWAWTILRFCFFVSNTISVPQIQLQLIPSQVLMQKVVLKNMINDGRRIKNRKWLHDVF